MVRDVAIRTDHAVLANLDLLRGVDHCEAVDVDASVDNDPRIGASLPRGQKHDMVVERCRLNLKIPRIPRDFNLANPALPNDLGAEQTQVRYPQTHHDCRGIAKYPVGQRIFHRWPLAALLVIARPSFASISRSGKPRRYLQRRWRACQNQVDK